jgi:hypothetical protein
MIVRRIDDEPDPEIEVRHPDGCPIVQIPLALAINREAWGCITGEIVASNGVDDIDGWRELPEGSYPIAVETEPSDYPGATDAYLVMDK